jgi:hypothetical protein
MSVKTVKVCDRCRAHRATAVRRENGKRKNYCRGCVAFMLGAIPESQAPRPTAAIAKLVDGQLEVHTGPTQTGYLERRVLASNDEVALTLGDA